MNNKVVTIIAGTILTLTAGSLPSPALNSSKDSVSNFATNLTTVNLDNGLNRTSNQTATKQVKGENGEFLITQRRRRYRRRVCRAIKRTVRRGRRISTARRRRCVWR